MPTEIISGLWIGSINDSYNKEFYIDNKINIVINCTNDQAFLNLDHLKKIRIPISNIPDINNDIFLLNQNKDKILQFINESIEENNIFIYCYNGITISPLIVALFMIKYGKISTDLIKDILKSKNSNIVIDFDLNMFR